jgi:hypothetical protein
MPHTMSTSTLIDFATIVSDDYNCTMGSNNRHRTTTKYDSGDANGSCVHSRMKEVNMVMFV